MFLATPFMMNNLSTNYFFNKYLRKNIKPFAEREGDWICSDCRNLNFAFRTQCNRCKKTKEESDAIKDKKESEEEKKEIKNTLQNEKKEENKKKIEENKNIKFKKEKYKIKESDDIETIKIVVNETKKKKQKYKNKHKKGTKKYSEKNINETNENMKKE